MIIRSPDQLTAYWLTETLRAKGRITAGAVTGVEQDPHAFQPGQTAEIVRLKLHYSADAAGLLPETMVLKLPKAGMHAEILSRGVNEVRFYQAVEAAGFELPAPICYDAAYEPGSQLYHILLEDLSVTHFSQPLPIPPTYAYCLKIVEGCARLHAAWWNNPALGQVIGERLTPERAAASERRLRDTVPAFFDFLGDALLPEQRKTIEALLASNFLQRLGQRLCAMQQVTLIHGDVHTGNVLLPRSPADGRVIFVDWQLCDIHVAALDLAFMMALHWNAERRSLFEKPLLAHYHRQLLIHGVTGYGAEDLWRDYRESVAVTCLIPIGQFRRKSPAGVVWFGLQDSLAAFRDLHCEEVLA